jgi:hypothetical protein
MIQLYFYYYLFNKQVYLINCMQINNTPIILNQYYHQVIMHLQINLPFLMAILTLNLQYLALFLNKTLKEVIFFYEFLKHH